MTHRTPFLASLCLLWLVSVIYPQAPIEKKNANQVKPSRTKAMKAEEPDPIVAQRQVIAISLLQSLADESRSFRDQGLRARVGARAADALWETDSEKARILFRRAWDEAEAGDAETARREAEEFQRQQSAGGAFIRRRPRDLRSEVLRLAAKRDRELGEELLKKLDETSERETKEAADRSRLDPASAPLAAAKRLQLARRLLEDGEVERALQFATPVLDSINRDSINFLSALREKNPAAADQGFLSLLARAQRDPASDANTVSGLSSYAFTPFLFVNFSPDGGASISQERRETAAPDLPADIRTTFFRIASEILLRPLPPPDQDLTTSGRVGKYMIIKRLLMKSDQPRAVELLEEAAAEARRIGGGNPDRARSLIAVATGLMEADRVRAWEIAGEVLKAANSAEGFREGSTVSAELRAKQMVLVTNAPAEEFDLLGLFRSLAKDDFNRSIELTKGFSGEAPRSVATLAVARSVLEKPKADSRTPD